MSLPLISAALLSSVSPLAQGADCHAARQAEAHNAALNQENEPTGQAAPPGSAPAQEAPQPAGPEDLNQQPETGEDQAGQASSNAPIIVTGDTAARVRDPLVEVNEKAFAITQGVDRAVVEPAADIYKEGLPKPLRRGLRNFFRNLLEPVNFLNYLLQLKPGKAFETLGRFTINSTIGVAGLIDVAKDEPFNLPYRRNGFANTLGYYGVGTGPFLVLPLVGATTLRDFLGGLADVSVLPTAVGKPFSSLKYAIPAYTVNSLEFRIEFDERLEAINAADDPYTAMREIYLCQREADIAALKNRPAPRDCSPAVLLAIDDGEIEEAAPEGIEPQGDIDTASQTDPSPPVDIEAAPPVETVPAEQDEHAATPASEEAPATPQ